MIFNFKALLAIAGLTVSFVANTQDKPLLFKENQALNGKMVAQQYSDLCTVAQGSLAYLAKGKKYDAKANHVGVIGDLGFTFEQVTKTLQD